MSGRPLPDITCYREDKKLIFCPGAKIKSTDISQPSASPPACSNHDGVYELVIKAVTFLRNHGKYTCEARNVVGNYTDYFRVNVTGTNHHLGITFYGSNDDLKWPIFCFLTHFIQKKLYYPRLTKKFYNAKI